MHVLIENERWSIATNSSATKLVQSFYSFGLEKFRNLESQKYILFSFNQHSIKLVTHKNKDIYSKKW